MNCTALPGHDLHAQVAPREDGGSQSEERERRDVAKPGELVPTPMSICTRTKSEHRATPAHRTAVTLGSAQAPAQHPQTQRR